MQDYLKHRASKFLTSPCSFKCSSSFLTLQVFVLGRKGLHSALKSLLFPCHLYICTKEQKGSCPTQQHGAALTMAQDNHRVAIDKLFYFLHWFSDKGGEGNYSNIFRHTVTSTVHTLGIHAGIQWISVLNSLSVTLQESKAKKSPNSLYLKGSSTYKNDFKFF